ncbi:unnamed protein product [Rhizopus stolonifer]
MEPGSSNKIQPDNANLSESIPLTTEEPIRRSWLREELEKVNRHAARDGYVTDEDDSEDPVVHGQNRIENAMASKTANSTGLKGAADIMACLSREISDYHERVESETSQYEAQIDELEELFMDDPELIHRTEKNKYIPYEPTPPISRDSSDDSVRHVSDDVRNQLLVFSDNVDVLEDMNRITTVQYYGAGKTGIIPAIYRKKSQSKMYLVAFDFGEESIHALEWTMGSIMRDNDEIHIAVVSNRDDNPEIVKASGLDKKSELSHLSNAITNRAKELLNKMMLFNVKLVTHALVGRVKDNLNKLMREYIYTMIICGSRGRSPVKRLLMGSVSTYLVHTSPVPVAVMRKPQQKKQESTRTTRSHSLSESVKSGQLHVDELS